MFPCGIPFLFLLAVTLVAKVASAWNVTVTFYKNAEFKGASYAWTITETQLCYNLACFDNQASSVKWEGIPALGEFKGKSLIAFFTGHGCKKDSRDWPTDGVINGIKDNYPMNFGLDGIDDAVSSLLSGRTTRNSRTARRRLVRGARTKIYSLVR
ncbi:hypothetical protein PHYSODRAFT_306553 [Phytophthora sojae]|uniref:Uncharacterized protein n=1 Tax=Phytophthora sojae (strain P6497) TaxID=1094619 RepID=G5A9S6_PHYSP|nr:hypothetical protein PHYSODRAFT_306553 [Phytophthora sojae]EGZ07356.1 hypothetical protein PHYSODRAFT_306553 [Phytophthora sojae]|eukprot:XP_009536922.1 hypothetical protein PHYSODRAFT_306553 [Phytophthora sojae]